MAIMGMTAIVSPVAVKKNTIRYDIPLCILMSLVVFVMASDTFIDGENADFITRSEGIILLAFFAIFMAY
jgi:cation:H+ antiporter